MKKQTTQYHKKNSLPCRWHQLWQFQQRRVPCSGIHVCMWSRLTTTTLLASNKMAPVTASCSISVTTVSLAVRSSVVIWCCVCEQWKCTYIVLGTLISNGQMTDRFTKAVPPVSHQPLVIFCHFYWRWNRQRRQVSKREFHLIWYFTIRVWGSVVDKANVSELFQWLANGGRK